MTQPDNSWLVGLARADITPTEPIQMSGYSARVSPSQGVYDPLLAKALAIQHNGAKPALIITTDLIGFDADFAELVFEDICKKTGLERERIIINASHTHAGPVFGLRYARYYGLDPDAPGPIARYNQMLRQRMTEIVAAALADLQPATLSWGMGAAMFAMNRRKPTPKGVIIAPNPRGYVDRSVPVLRVDDPTGRPRAVMFGYACHNTTMGPDNLMISAEYAGFAQRYIESAHLGTQAMFLMGCGADANPYPRGRYDLAHLHGESLGAEVCRVLQEKLQPVRGPLRIAFDYVDMPLEPQPTPEELESLRRMGTYYAQMADRIQHLINTGKPWATHYRTPIAVWQFGEDITLVRLSGEVVGDYIRLLEAALGPLNLWIAAYCDDAFGYLPSARVHKEGGYEARDFITGFGFLAATVEEVIVRKVTELARKVGRHIPQKG